MFLIIFIFHHFFIYFFIIFYQGWNTTEVNDIWAFGPIEEYTNILVNTSGKNIK